MAKVFDFSEIEKSEATIQRTWDEFRKALTKKAFAYNDIQSALGTTFLRVFDDLFTHNKGFLEVKIEEVFSSDSNIVRAARLSDCDPVPGYDRFIPNSKYIKDSNRFSPIGGEWLYLAIGTRASNISEQCALQECRAKLGERFALCDFRLNDAYKGKQVIDLTIAREFSYDDINNDLEEYGQKIRDREVSKGIAKGIITGTIEKPEVTDIIPLISKWATYTYARLLSDQIFLPVTTEDKNLVYAPFQCLAQYFLVHGYVGIIYSSTVFPEGRNIVLFDKNAAEPYNDIKIVTV